MSTFVFDPEKFRETYKRFAEDVLSDAELVGLYHAFDAMAGDGEGHFHYPPAKVETIVFTAVCHLATLHTSELDQPGRVASASQGSVSTSFDNVTTQSDSGQFWNLTKCGALFWAMTAPYRTGIRFYGSPRFHPYG